MKLKLTLISTTLSLLSVSVFAEDISPLGNTKNESFGKAKKWLYSIHNTADMRKTLYCDWDYDTNRNVNIPKSEVITKYKKRFLRVEAEHQVAVSHYANSLKAWHTGHPMCKNSKGESYKGRKCATKASKQYRLFQADLYILSPSSGGTNAIRSDYQFTQFGRDEPSILKTCSFKVSDQMVEPRTEIKGTLARVYLYAEYAYPTYKLSNKQKKLFEAWNRSYPADPNSIECKRYPKILKIQGNDNPLLRDQC